MSKSSKTTSEQHARFVETARALGCDEDEAAFDEKLKMIARQTLKGKPEQVRKGKLDEQT